MQGNLPILPWDEVRLEPDTWFLSHRTLTASPLPPPEQHTVFFPCSSTHKHSIWLYQHKVMWISRHSPCYRLKKIFFFFTTITHCTVTAPSRRSNGEVSCFWKWRLWPLYYQYPVVRMISKIYTRMQNRVWQLYMNRKPNFEVYGL